MKCATYHLTRSRCHVLRESKATVLIYAQAIDKNQDAPTLSLSSRAVDHKLHVYSKNSTPKHCDKLELELASAP